MSKKTSKKQVLIIVGIVLLLLVAAGAGMMLQLLQKNTQQKPTETENNTTTDSRSAENKTVEDFLAKGDYTQANQYIQEGLNKSDVADAQKYDLYIQQGAVANEQGNKKLALDSYQKADAIKANRDISVIIAQTAVELGDKPLAITYYKNAIKQINPQDPLAQELQADYEANIKGLGG